MHLELSLNISVMMVTVLLIPLSPVLQAEAMDAMSLKQQLPPYTFFTQSISQQQTQVPSGLSSSMMQGSNLQRGTQLPPLTVSISTTVPQSPPGIQTPSSLAIDINSVCIHGFDPIHARVHLYQVLLLNCT